MELKDYYTEDYFLLLNEYKKIQKEKSEIHNISVDILPDDWRWNVFSKQLKNLDNQLLKLNNKIRGLEPRVIVGDKVDLVLVEYKLLWNYIIYNKNEKRVGEIEFRGYHTDKYCGDVGYYIDYLYRGNNYAYYALSLLGDTLRIKNYEDFWISSKFCNYPSISTIRKYGGKLLAIRDDVYMYECSTRDEINKKILIK